MADHPSKVDIQSVFKKLKSIPSNKQCFDCHANNPCWASVTYGVFLCMDCSAVHRSLGVHISFIRSIQLDVNWTWVQLRAMQVGGNGNAESFFTSHGCTSTDAQVKYRSRAAQLYKGKLEQLALQAMKMHGTKLFIDSHESEPKPSPRDTEVDFFQEHEKEFPTKAPGAVEDFTSMSLSHPIAVPGSEAQPRNGAGEDPATSMVGPKVDHVLSVSPTEAAKIAAERKPIIGKKTGQAKKGGLGGRKGGLGAAKVAADFSAIESAAEQHDRDQAMAIRIAAEDAVKQKQLAEEEEANRLAAMRLAYQDISAERQKKEERLKMHDPQKAEQLERLGMGSIGLGNKGISHSAFTGMKTIEQEGDPRTGASGFSTQPSSTYGAYDYLDKYSSRSSATTGSRRGGGGFEVVDEDSYGSRGVVSSPRTGSGFDAGVGSTMSSTSAWERDLGALTGSGSRAGYTSPSSASKPNDPWDDEGSSRFTGRPRKQENTAPVSSDDIQRRFANAKGISSEAYFGSQDSEAKSSLARFEGSSAISSDDVFGTGPKNQSYSSGYYSNLGDLNDIKDGVRQGVTKVAGKLSTLASGVVNSLQDRYGHY